jgi:hypothetical protein
MRGIGGLKGRSGAAAVGAVGFVACLAAALSVIGGGEGPVAASLPRRLPSASPSPSSQPGEDGILRLAGPKRMRYCFHDHPDDVATPAPGSAREEDYNAQFAYITHRVEELRKLFFYSEVTPSFVGNDGMRQQLLAQSRHTMPVEKAEQDELTLRMLGALKGPIDLSATKTPNPLGVYFPSTTEAKTGTVLVLVDDYHALLEGGEEVVLSHELTHALTDQQLGLPYNENFILSTRDAALAHSALAEGDATLLEKQFANSSLTEEELSDYTDNPPPTTYAPPQGTTRKTRSFYLAAAGGFPYSFGTSFVCAMYLRGGWKAVDEIYEDPPDTTAEILYPDRYHSDDAPHDPADPPTPSGWRALPAESFGAADLMFLLEAPGTRQTRGLSDAYERAAAWGGGEVHLYEHGREHALSLDLSQHVYFDDLCDTIEAWYRVSFPIADEYRTGPNERFAIANRWGAAVLRCDGDDVRLGVAPSLQTARTLTR